MLSIKEDIKNETFQKCYLLCGTENYLIRQYRNNLIHAMINPEDNMNYTKYSGNGFSATEVIELAETMPFFADRRVILIEGSEWMKEGGEKIAEYLPNKPETTFFVFSIPDIDKRSKLYKAIRDQGHVAEMKSPSEGDLKTWIVNKVREEKKNITVKAVEELMERTGSDMELLSEEMEKLFCYAMDKEAINAEDVEAICTTRVGNHIFDMIEAVANKKQEKALKMYYELLELHEPPMRILFLVGKQFSNLLCTKDLRNKGFDRKRIAEKMNIQPFIVDKYMTQAGKFSVELLKHAVEDCVEADASVKMGKMTDRLSVELILVKYSNGL